MPVKIVNRSYIERYTEGATDWLLGNVGDWQKAIFTAEASIELNATQQEPVRINKIENHFELTSGKKWSDFGFDIGQEVTLQYTYEYSTNNNGTVDATQTVIDTYNIIQIYGSKMVVDSKIDVQGFENIPLNFGNSKISDVIFYVDEEPEGVLFQYAHLTNSNNSDSQLRSVIDSSETKFVYPNIKAENEGIWKQMEAIGFQSGMSIRNVRVRKLGSSSDELFAIYNMGVGNFSLDIVTSFATVFVNNFAPFFLTTNSQVPYAKTQFPGYIPVNPFNGVPANGNQAYVFLYNLPYDVKHDVRLSTVFSVISEQNINFFQNRLDLNLFRYTNGPNMNFADVYFVQRWSNVNTMIGLEQAYNDVISIDGKQGESYGFGFTYTQDSYDRFQREGIVVQVKGGTLELSQPNKTLSQGNKKRYQFEVEYMISPFFEEVSDLTEKQIPDFLKGDGSLTDNVNVELYPEWNNPNVVIRNDLKETERLGNTGWFDENFNELKNDFKVDSVDYFNENGNRVDAVDYLSKTRVRVVVSGVQNIDTSTESGFGFFWIPSDEEVYKQKETPYYQNLFVQSGSLEDGFKVGSQYPGPYIGAGKDGAYINSENVVCSTNNGKLIIEFVLVPNTKFFQFFDKKEESERQYGLFVSVADGSLERNFSDRVSLLVDVRTMKKSIPPSGPYPYIDNLFLEHPERNNDAGTDKLKAIVQDDLLARMPFRIKKDLDNNFQSITFGVEIYNKALDKSYILENYAVDVSQSLKDSDGFQQFDFEGSRGYFLGTENNKNLISIKRETTLDTNDFIGFMMFYAFRVRYEDWIQRNNVPTEFFDSSLLNNGNNNDWIQYAEKRGWKLNFFTLVNVEEKGELKQYKNQWRFEVTDYDKNENIEVTHNYYRDSDGTLLNVGTDQETGRPLGVILDNEKTKIEIIFRILNDDIFDVENTYAITTIEVDKGAGSKEFREISSAWDSESDNPLKGIENEKRLTLEFDPTKKILKTTCVVEPEILEDAQRYRVTARLGCGKNGTDGSGTFDNGLYEFRYENQYE